MGGVMRPVGPESSETYWVRRALVAGAMLVLLIVVLLFLVNWGGSPGQAAPGAGTTPTSSASASTPPAAGSTTGPATTGPATARATHRATARTPSVTPTTATSPASGAPASASARSTTRRSGPAKPSGPTSSSPAAKKSAEPSRRAEPSAAQPATCSPKDLRATLRGDRHRVEIGSTVTFRLSLINGAEKSCRVGIGPESFELKIYSGTDRIWSSDDCARRVPRIDRVTRPEQAVAWSMTWNGKRSRHDTDCTARPESPRPGYYYATAQLRGAKPVQFLMILS